jgi:hypothetical protein
VQSHSTYQSLQSQGRTTQVPPHACWVLRDVYFKNIEGMMMIVWLNDDRNSCLQRVVYEIREAD